MFHTWEKLEYLVYTCLSLFWPNIYSFYKSVMSEKACAWSRHTKATNPRATNVDLLSTLTTVSIQP